MNPVDPKPIFDGPLCSQTFKVHFSKIVVDGKEHDGDAVGFSYSENLKPVFSFGELAAKYEITFNSEIHITVKGSTESISLYVNSWTHGDDGDVVKAVLKICPSLLMLSSSKVTKIRALVLSGPEMVGASINVMDTVFGESITLKKFGNSNQSTETSANGEKDLFGILEIDGNFESTNMLDAVWRAGRILDFAKGSHCGIGHVVGYGESGEAVALAAGFGRHDNRTKPQGWYVPQIQGSLGEISSLINEIEKDETLLLAFKQTQAYYRAANVTRADSLELSIIASHSALESVVNYILEYRAGWSNGLQKAREIRFCDKARAAGAFAGIIGDLYKNLPELQKYARSKNGGMDAYETLSHIRNKLVHQDKNFVSNGAMLHETWCLCQWLVEVFTFFLLGYQGKMFDRRRYTGWAEQPTNVPLSR